MSWFEEAVVYQVYPLGLTGAPYENDGVSAPTSRMLQLVDNGWIDHMVGLNATCLLLNPVFESGTHGYDTRDYLQVDRRLGTNADLRRVVDACHEHGIKVLLDGVFNHVGRGFWAFEDVLARRQESPYAGWFRIDFEGDNEWGDGFSYDCWEGVGELVTLNHDNFELNAYLADVIRRWEGEFGIDGLRLDVAYCLDLGFLGYLRQVADELTARRSERLGPRDGKFALVGETLFGDYRRWMGEGLCDAVINYELYKGLWSSMNARNMHEVAYSLKRQSGSEPWDLYTGCHLLTFLDNHDVARIATQLADVRQLPALYGLLFGAPGVPALYYGSEWGITGEKRPGDHEIRPALAAPESNALTELIAALAAARRPGAPGSEALAWGDYEELQVSPTTLVFQRASEHERVIVAVNAGDEACTLHFDARCGRATDLVTGAWHDFGGGSTVAPLTTCLWLCER
ncbi:alpha-amylase family glycosyl hydrolase [Olsenella sp. HMSC062G07]|uniref:alpha-amylase family glycosyl hydrolase n=1 Tax=Olsenella sp. HMSC062G07 TaxID=1739330 RepID=UPI0008A6205C|nr:alpha-amylase family glycosyl hydrolase [Olsenella sp. HMSC062G07]OFK23435.1 maltodextrin glucosidase [Olsenella sp. HMSC062G07]